MENGRKQRCNATLQPKLKLAQSHQIQGKGILQSGYLKVVERLHLHDRSHGTEGKGRFNTLVWAKRSEYLEGTSRSKTKATEEHKRKKCHKICKYTKISAAHYLVGGGTCFC